MLKNVEQHVKSIGTIGNTRYISPERGGFVSYEAGIEQAIINNLNWMSDNRRKNQSENFRQQSAYLFRQLELLELRAIEKDQLKLGYTPRTFDATVDQINTLLDRVRIEREKSKAFLIKDKETDAAITSESLSSGESELVSLGIEFLSFVSEAQQDKANLLFIDEPDAHLHPDLQDRLAKFLVKIVKAKPVKLIIATHSTALVSSLSSRADVNIAFMRRKDTKLSFKPVSDVDRSILPIFGAHPLSNVFNEAPILLIEGEDDERVWQQAVRSSNGRIRVYPCAIDGGAHFADFETEVNNVIEAVYDNAKAFSLRDRDLQPAEIDDFGHVVRMRLSCRAAENLMLSDEVLASTGVTWPGLETLIGSWLKVNQDHQYYAAMQEFVDGGLDRKVHDLKSIRNILVGLMSNKPWEVLVGRAIAALANGKPAKGPVAPGSLSDYLGEKVRDLILGLAQQPQAA
ncbi:ATP-binding protein [Mesorhizobium sp. M0959]